MQRPVRKCRYSASAPLSQLVRVDNCSNLITNPTARTSRSWASARRKLRDEQGAVHGDPLWPRLPALHVVAPSSGTELSLLPDHAHPISTPRRTAHTAWASRTRGLCGPFVSLHTCRFLSQHRSCARKSYGDLRGNSSSSHAEGCSARATLEHARERVATVVLVDQRRHTPEAGLARDW